MFTIEIFLWVDSVNYNVQVFFFFKTTLNALNTVWLASISSGLSLSPMFRPRTLDWYPVMFTQVLADSSHWESWSLQKDVFSLFTIYAHVIAWLSNIHVYIIKSSFKEKNERSYVGLHQVNIIHLFSQNFFNGTRGTGHMDMHVFTYTNSMNEQNWNFIFVKNKYYNLINFTYENRKFS